jgi:basic amino acid/polyamine antiporter, APA family
MKQLNKKGLSLLDSSMLIMGSMIGSGIFIVSSEIARTVQSPGMLLLVWGITAIMTVFGALSYGELAAAMPNAGGQYVYLKEAYSPIFGFLYGWTVFTIIQTGTIAAVAVAFAKFSGIFLPAISPDNLIFRIGDFHFSTLQALGIGIILLLTFSNFRSIKTGALVQNIFTFTKIGALAFIIIFGLIAGIQGSGNAANFSTPGFPDVITLATIGIFCSAMVGSLFSADAWNNITYIAGEVQNPKRNLPLSMLIGTGVVMAIYFFVNVIYIYILPLEAIQNAPQERVGTLLMNTLLGPAGLYLMALLVMISTFGCLNGIIISGARVYYAMAKDGLFFPQAAKLNSSEVPANSLGFQALWASVLVLSGSYGDLLNYVIFAVLVFYILTVSGVFILRIRRPGMERPYKTLGYPVVPAVYLVLSVCVAVSLLIYKPEFSTRGLLMVLLGIPVYYLTRLKKK